LAGAENHPENGSTFLQAVGEFRAGRRGQVHVGDQDDEAPPRKARQGSCRVGTGNDEAFFFVYYQTHESADVPVVFDVKNVHGRPGNGGRNGIALLLSCCNAGGRID